MELYWKKKITKIKIKSITKNINQCWSGQKPRQPSIDDLYPTTKATITHVLCDCVSTEEARRWKWHEAVTPAMLTTHPDITRRILAAKYGDLQKCCKTISLPAPADSAFAPDKEEETKATGTLFLVLEIFQEGLMKPSQASIDELYPTTKVF